MFVTAVISLRICGQHVVVIRGLEEMHHALDQAVDQCCRSEASVT